ncbi:hypothetical protein GCM10027612_16870 [Microbispora bryophytorum subsp. camponoti]
MLVALCHALEGHDAERIEAASAEALAIADALGDLHLRCMALNARYWVCLTPDRRDDLETLGHDLLAASAAAGLLGYQTLGHFSLLMVALSRNDWTTARRHADKAMELSTSGQLGLALGILAFLDAVHLLVRGEFERAESVYTRLGERLARTGDANGALVGTVGRFVVKLTAGRVHESVEELAALWERLPQDVGELYARALAGAGRLEEARVAWASARVPRRDYYWLVFMSLRADNAIAFGHRAAAEECYRLLLSSDGELAGLHSGSVTLGPVAHTLGDLAAFLGRPGDAEAHYLRAAEVARQVGSPTGRRPPAAKPTTQRSRGAEDEPLAAEVGAAHQRQHDDQDGPGQLAQLRQLLRPRVLLDPGQLEAHVAALADVLLHLLPVLAGDVPHDDREDRVLLLLDVLVEQVGQPAQRLGQLGRVARDRLDLLQQRVEFGVVLAQLAQVDLGARRADEQRPQVVVLRLVVVVDAAAQLGRVLVDGGGAIRAARLPARGDLGGDVGEAPGVGAHRPVRDAEAQQVGSIGHGLIVRFPTCG